MCRIYKEKNHKTLLQDMKKDYMRGGIDVPHRKNRYWKWPVRFSHSVVSDSLQPQELQDTRLPFHGILQARILEWIAIPFSIEYF